MKKEEAKIGKLVLWPRYAAENSSSLSHPMNYEGVIQSFTEHYAVCEFSTPNGKESTAVPYERLIVVKENL